MSFMDPDLQQKLEEEGEKRRQAERARAAARQVRDDATRERNQAEERERAWRQSERLASDLETRREAPAPRVRRYGPKTAEHPAVGTPCPACSVPFCEGDYTALVELGPGANPEKRAAARAGDPYTGTAVEAHYACVTGVEP